MDFICQFCDRKIETDNNYYNDYHSSCLKTF